MRGIGMVDTNELIDKFAHLLLEEAYEEAWAEEPEIMRQIESKVS